MGRKLPNLLKKTNRSDDYSVYYFLHIPKTAGTTFAQYLRSHYGAEDALEPQTWNELYGHYLRVNPLTSLQDYINKHQLIIGHYGNVMRRYIEGPVKTVTILRNPLDRTISQLCHIKNEPTYNNWVRSRFIFPHENITDVIEDPERLGFFENYQLRYLAHDFDYIKEVEKSGFHGSDLLFDSSHSFRQRRPEGVLVESAREVLDGCHLVGVQDYVQEAMLLLSFKTGWHPPVEIPRLTSATDDSQVALLTNEHKQAIMDITREEHHIYELYKKKFEEVYLHFVNEFLGRDIKRWSTFMKNRASLNNQIHNKLQANIDLRTASL